MKTRSLNFPERIPVAGMIYRVEYRKRIRDEDGSLSDGACDLEEKIIYLLTKYPTPEAAREAFRHEHLHAIKHEYSVEVSHTDLDRIAQGLTQADAITNTPTR